MILDHWMVSLRKRMKNFNEWQEAVLKQMKKKGNAKDHYIHILYIHLYIDVNVYACIYVCVYICYLKRFVEKRNVKGISSSSICYMKTPFLATFTSAIDDGTKKVRQVDMEPICSEWGGILSTPRLHEYL